MVPVPTHSKSTDERGGEDLQWPFLGIDSHEAFLAKGIKAKATPLPILRCGDQAALHRVAVNITKLLDPLLCTPDIEIVKTPFPNRCGMADFVAQGSCKALLDDLHHNGGIGHLGLGYQEMEMLGHGDVTEDDETVLSARLFQQPKEEIAALGGAEFGLAAVAATGDEVDVVIAIETV